ncbi:hypothetical protein Y032_0721g1820 [Ancylostoma ceylanicum]|uniref:Uncharacterized protein n=1 Tax=Ancylostoma ceylanicum TaxID=53326 RepID=A0A016WH70_9BILA|nr:hypothetical protein Y032_0721g1820 [Ancylostoma ceylanicum]
MLHVRELGRSRRDSAAATLKNRMRNPSIFSRRTIGQLPYSKRLPAEKLTFGKALIYNVIYHKACSCPVGKAFNVERICFLRWIFAYTLG